MHSPSPRPPARERALAAVLVITGAIGWFAAFRLTLDKLEVLVHPDAQLDCNVSVLVQCGRNLGSWQGALLGFPNPILGLAGFVAPIAVGVALLAGASFARWFWIAFNAGVAGAMAFVVWLMTQSIFVLGTLCIYCLITWSAVIPLFLVLTARNARAGVFGRHAVATGVVLERWVVTVDLALYVVIALIAELRLEWMQELLGVAS